MCRILPLFPDNKFSRLGQSWVSDTAKMIRRVWHSTLFICAIHKISVGHMFLWSNPLDRYHWLMIAFITWNSNSSPLIEGLSISNPCRFDLSVFEGLPGRTDDLGINSPALWPTEPSSQIASLTVTQYFNWAWRGQMLSCLSSFVETWATWMGQHCDPPPNVTIFDSDMLFPYS